jgi:hypothetical protein
MEFGTMLNDLKVEDDTNGVPVPAAVRSRTAPTNFYRNNNRVAALLTTADGDGV